MSDHVADTSGVEMAKLARLHEFPAFVKQASFPVVMAPGRLASHMYADQVQERFPCHTAASTWLSAAYFMNKKAQFHPKDAQRIERRIDKYAQYWHITGEVSKIKAKVEAMVKTASADLPDSSYAFIVRNADGSKDRCLRLTNAVEVKVAAEWLDKHKGRMPFETRNQIAINILEKAASFGADLGDRLEFLEQQAGRGVGDPAAVIGMLKSRGRLAKNSAVVAEIEKLAAAVEAAPRTHLHPTRLVKLAITVDQLDRALSITHLYDSGMPRPEQVIFSATFAKAAAEVKAAAPTTSGSVYTKEQLKKVALVELRDAFGNEFAERVGDGLRVDPEKLATEIKVLPLPDSELFDEIMHKSGQAPPLIKAASVRVGFTNEELEALAAQYAATA